LPTPLQPPLHPGTGKPIGPEDLAPVFPMNLIEQEVSQQRWFDIPPEVLEKLLIWRPTPLHRAYALEKALGTPARIYYKTRGSAHREATNRTRPLPRPITTKVFGIKRITTETGAGQWGSALSFACNLFGLECKVYMVRESVLIKNLSTDDDECVGRHLCSQPEQDTHAGRAILKETPDSSGKPGHWAISEAIEDAVTSKDTRYSLGSVLKPCDDASDDHRPGGEEAIGKKFGEKKVDVVTGCVGGGSKLCRPCLPLLSLTKINGADITIIPAEPTSCPTMTRAPFVYDFGDTAATTRCLPCTASDIRSSRSDPRGWIAVITAWPLL